MTTHDDEDFLRAGSDGAMYRLLTDLERASSSTLPAGRRAEIARALAQEARNPRPRALMGRRPPLTAVRKKPTDPLRHLRWLHQKAGPGASLAAALLLAIGGLLGYLHAQRAEPVSAAQVLNRARLAATSAGSNDVIHEISIVHIMPNPDGFTSGVPWLGTSSDGQLVRDGIQDSWAQFADDHTLVRLDSRAEDSFARVRFHVVATNNEERSYDGRSNSVTISLWKPRGSFLTSQRYGIGLPANVPLPAAVVQQLLQGKLPQQAPGDTTRLLGRESLDGATVDVVQVTHPVLNQGPDGRSIWTQIFTYAIDAHSYVIDRSVITTLDGSGHILGSSTIQLIKREIEPVSALPRGVFTFATPPGTCVYAASPLKPGDIRAPLCLPRPTESGQSLG